MSTEVSLVATPGGGALDLVSTSAGGLTALGRFWVIGLAIPFVVACLSGLGLLVTNCLCDLLGGGLADCLGAGLCAEK